MVDFHPIEIGDRESISRYLLQNGVQNCDFAFANLFCWQDTFRSEKAFYDGCLLIRFEYGEGRTGYMQPIGGGDVRQIVELLKADAERRGTTLQLFDCTPQWQESVATLFPDEFAFASLRSSSDYIYLSSDLAELRGRAYQPKRNHINRFKSEYEWHYEPLSAASVADCEALNRRWLAEKEYHSRSERAEQAAMQRAFACFDDLALRGGVLYADHRAVAFTYGSPLNGDTFCTHVEKADIEVEGAAAMINQLFAASLVGEFRYINREDDLGLEGLRFSKMSYHPHLLLSKVVARWLCDRERQIRSLWERVFGDEREVVDEFMINYYRPEHCFVRCVGDKVVAMLHLLPMRGEMSRREESDGGGLRCEYMQEEPTSGKGLRVAYIYAVATDAAYRCRGYASSLVEEAIRSVEQSGEFDIMALIPSGEPSKRIYAAHGFGAAMVPMQFAGDFDFGTGDKAQDVAMIRRIPASTAPENGSAGGSAGGSAEPQPLFCLASQE